MSKVAVMKTKPSSVVNDYGKLMEAIKTKMVGELTNSPMPSFSSSPMYSLVVIIYSVMGQIW